MTITLTPQTIITASALLAAIIAIIAYFVKIVRWFDQQKKQDSSIKDLGKKHDEDIKAIQNEQQLIIYGLLACLRGLQEQGCNGPVTEAINKIDKYLNKMAHAHEE